MGSDKWANADLLFTTGNGTAVDPRNVHRHFKSALKRAGLRDCRFHDLRHSCATLLLAGGADMSYVQRILRHSQIALTMNTYAHLPAASLSPALDRLSAQLNGSPAAD